LPESIDRAFEVHAGQDDAIDVKKLQKAFGIRTEYLARRVFTCLDQNQDGVIRRGEFIDGVRRLVFGTDREKLLFAFRMHDHDGDGTLGQQELLRMITMSLAEEEVQSRVSQPPSGLAYCHTRGTRSRR
jgi:Ca2+-binding EF-hand superfamily protein